MSAFEQINADLEAILGETDADIITPASLALALRDRYGAPSAPCADYAALEHYKQMARAKLRRFEAASDESPSYQGDLFTGELQARYPIPVKAGDARAYKLRDLLTDDEIAWNVEALRKQARARLDHADRLLAWSQNRKAA